MHNKILKIDKLREKRLMV